VFCSKIGSLYPNCVVRRTTAAGQARTLAAQAVREGFSTVVAAGGDGTANEVVNGIGDVPGGFATSRFGILPLGTVNVFARELGLPNTFPGVAKAIALGREKLIDLGRAEYSCNGKMETRYFLQLAGAGIDARAVEIVSWKLKKKIGPLAYVWAALRAILEKHPLISVDAGNRVSGQQVLLGNGRFYGGSFAVFPSACLDDGLLDVCVVETVSVLRVFELALGFVTGNLYRFCPALHLRSSIVKLTSPNRVALQLDGENAGELPVTFSVLPNVLRVIVP
jgi:diacylglycerol kinase (ATP)